MHKVKNGGNVRANQKIVDFLNKNARKLFFGREVLSNVALGRHTATAELSKMEAQSNSCWPGGANPFVVFYKYDEISRKYLKVYGFAFPIDAGAQRFFSTEARIGNGHR